MVIVNKLTKIYRKKGSSKVVALDNVSLKFKKTGLTIILGKSGSGKSTLLNLLGGIDSPASGEIMIDGQNINNFGAKNYDNYRNSCVGFVFQEYNLIEEYTVGANVALAVEMQGKRPDKEAIDAVLRQVDLVDEKGDTLYGRKINELSGGQKQRVAIARAIIKDPKILLADEPTGALDEATGDSLFSLLKELSKKCLVIVVTHNREMAEQYGDRIIELADGKVVKDSAPIAASAEQEGAAPIKFGRDRLIFRRAFAMGAQALSCCKFRLIMAILISVIALTAFSFATTATFIDPEKTAVSLLYSHGQTVLGLESENERILWDDPVEHTGSRYVYEAPFDEEQLKQIDTYTDGEYAIANSASWFISSDDAEEVERIRDLITFTATPHEDVLPDTMEDLLLKEIRFRPYLVETSSTELLGLKKDGRLSDTVECRLPETFQEIAITDIKAESLLQYGYKNDEGISCMPSDIDELIGAKIDGFTIVGIYETEIPLAEARALMEEQQDEGARDEMRSGLAGSIAGYSFVAKGFFRSVYSEFMPNVVFFKASGNQASDLSLCDALTYGDGIESSFGVSVVSSHSSLVYGVFSFLSESLILVCFIAGGVLALIAVLLIFLYFNVSLEKRKKEFGILRAIGAHKSDIVTISVVEAVLVAAIIFVITLLLTAVACIVTNHYLFVPVMIFDVWPILILFGLSFGMSLLASAIPVYRAVSKKPIDIINVR